MSTDGPDSERTKKLGGITGKGFMPGKSGNPSGRPKKRVMSEYYEALIEKALPEDLRVALKLEKGATYGQAIVLSQARAAIKGRTEAAREIADRTEGRVGQPVEVSGADGGPLLIETLNAGRERVRAAREKHPKPAGLEP